MADYVYLLETRLSLPQQTALNAVRDVVRQRGLTLFLVGGAVRDLISGSPVRDLDFAVQGNALELRKPFEAAGATYSGEAGKLQALYLRFPSGVRIEVGSTLSATYPKPGKPVYSQTSILDDLRRRDFTANAMALSLNDGSYGLLMDPLNGVADIENRELRLVSNYGFIEDPVRMIRAARFMARLGWHMDERTQARYENGKAEEYAAALQPAERAYETEELFHEEEPLRVMRRLEDEGWLQKLAPALSVAHVNVAELGKLREAQLQLETRGIRVDAAAANFPLLTSKVPQSDVAAIKKSFPRAGFVREIDSLEAEAKDLSAQLLSKAMAKPSDAYQLILRSSPVTVLWAAYSTRSSALQNRFKSFYTEWPQAQTKLPYLLMNEMRITPDVPGYEGLLEKLFYALMDGRLGTPEEMRAFLEPYSPPAPPPPVSLRRPRAPRKEAKAPKTRKKAADAVPANEEAPPALAASSSEQAVAPAEPASQTTVARKKQPSPVAAEQPKTSVASTKSAPQPVSEKVPAAGKKLPPVKTAAKAVLPAKGAGKAVTKKPAPAATGKKAAAPVKKAPPKTASNARQTPKSSRKPAKAPAKGPGVKKPAKAAAKTSAPSKGSAAKKVAAKKSTSSKSPAKAAKRPVSSKGGPTKKAAAKRR